MPGYDFDVDAALKAGHTYGDIANYLASKTGFDVVKARQSGAHDEDIINYITGKSNQPTAATAQDQIKKTFGVSVDPVTLASGAAGTAAGMAAETNPATAPFGTYIGSGTMGAVDEFLRHVTGEKNTGLGESIVDATGKAAINEVGGRVLDGILRFPTRVSNAVDDVLGQQGINPITHPGVINKEGIYALNPTLSQILRANGSKWAGLANGFENLFSPATKSTAMQSSHNLAVDAGDDFVSSLTGNRAIKLGDSDALAGLVKDRLEDQYMQLKIASNARGEMVKMVAEANKETDPIMKMQTSKVLGSNGQPVTQLTKVGDKELYGPVKYDDTMQKLVALKNNLFKSNAKPDPNNPLYKAINDVFENLNAAFDKNGNLVSFDRTDFGTAWADKQIFGKLGYEVKNMPDNVKTAFKSLNGAIDSDIKNSMATWKIGAQQASQLYDEANLIVQKRFNLFSGQEQTGKTVSDLIYNTTGNKAAFYNILDDPKKLENFLLTNKITIPDGTGSNYTNVKYISSNAKADAQAAMIQRALNGATMPAQNDSNINSFNAFKLNEFFNDPERQESLRKIYGSENLSNVKQLFKNIAIVSEKGTGVGGVGASRYLGLKAGSYGISLGAGMAALMASGQITSGALAGGIGLTVTLGAHALAKAMTDPGTARILINLAQNVPLGMSTQMATRFVTNSIRGQSVTLNYPDGNSVDGKINKEGKFIIPFNVDLSKTPTLGSSNLGRTNDSKNSSISGNPGLIQ